VLPFAVQGYLTVESITDMSENNNTKPDIEEIIGDLRQGMDDTTLLQDSHPEMGNQQKLNSSLRKASETADILGRCGGSLRGKLCKLLARIALPVVEQINMHHSAVVDSLNAAHNIQKEDLENRISKLETETKELKAGSKS